jgi:hypothetical protein
MFGGVVAGVIRGIAKGMLHLFPHSERIGHSFVSFEIGLRVLHSILVYLESIIFGP